jgi:hypothetical protein
MPSSPARLLRRALAPILAAALLGGALVATPAQAATPDRWGFAYLHTPIPGFGTVLDPARQWGSWKAFAPALWATVDPIAVGRYRVTFPMTASLGVAHVTAISNDPRWCQIISNQPAGANQVVEVACYRHGGMPDWSRFAVMHSSSSGPLAPPGGGYAYLAADPFGGLLQSYNSTGAANAVAHVGAGQYLVSVTGLGLGQFDGNVQVTAQHAFAPRRCKVANWLSTAPDHRFLVWCFDHTNTLTDTSFNLTYHRERAVFGGLAPPKNFGYLWRVGLGGPSDFNSQGGVNSVIPAGAGLELVQFPLVGFRETHIQVTAFGASVDYCGLQSVWQLSGSTVIARNVVCFNGAGVKTNNPYYISYTSRV